MTREPFYCGIKDSQCLGCDLRGTWLRFPDPFALSIEVVKLAFHRNSDVFVETKDILLDANGDLYQLAAV